MTRTEQLLKVRSLKKTFRLGELNINAVDDISFDVFPGEYVGLLGPSGSGKTTLLNLISGIIGPTAGSIQLGDVSIDRLNNSQIRDFRLRNIGLVFQEHLLVDSLTAIENVELPLLFAKVPQEERMRKSMMLLSELGLEDKIHHLPSELSGGEQQRVGIARSLVFDPKIILADEPTGDLDSKTGAKIIKLFKTIATEYDRSIIMVSHDPRHRGYFDRTLEMKDGHLITSLTNS